jgi:hypothetical protein
MAISTLSILLAAYAVVTPFEPRSPIAAGQGPNSEWGRDALGGEQRPATVGGNERDSALEALQARVKSIEESVDRMSRLGVSLPSIKRSGLVVFMAELTDPTEDRVARETDPAGKVTTTYYCRVSLKGQGDGLRVVSVEVDAPDPTWGRRSWTLVHGWTHEPGELHLPVRIETVDPDGPTREQYPIRSVTLIRIWMSE